MVTVNVETKAVFLFGNFLLRSTGRRTPNINEFTIEFGPNIRASKAQGWPDEALASPRRFITNTTKHTIHVVERRNSLTMINESELS